MSSPPPTTLLGRGGCRIKPVETWPAQGVGGVRGTGEAHGFYGSYCGGGSLGCMPLGCFDLTTVPPESPSFFKREEKASSFVGLLKKDFLELEAAADAKRAEEPSPKSVVGFDFGAEVEAERDLATDQTAWCEKLTTD